MPKPVTAHDLLDLVRRSRLVEEPRLTGFLDRSGWAGAAAPQPDWVLDRLVAEGLLTRFQADQLGAGRWRGFTIGRYRLLDKLGSGGMGQVYLAEPAAPGGGPARVAVKVIDARLANDPVARERFTREAWAAAALAHPNIVAVLAVHPDDEPPHLVLEYVDGVTLQAAVARTGTFAAGTAAFVGAQVASGLDRACEVGLVHRDVKPANVVIDRAGAVKLLDLGIVRVPWAGDLTQRMDARTVLGTADYLAPEQAVDSSAVDTRADVYALGATLYFLLAGHPPFPDGSPDEKLIRKQTADPPPIDVLRPDVPAGLAAVVARMMARAPDARYPRPAAAAAALAPWAYPDSGFPGGLFPVDRGTLIDCRSAATPPDARRPPPAGPPTAVLGPAGAPTTELPAPAPPPRPEPKAPGPWLTLGLVGAALALAAAEVLRN